MSAARQCVELNGTCRGNSLALERDGQVRCLTHATDPVRVRRREERNAKGGFGRVQGWPEGVPLPRIPQTLAALPRWCARVAEQVLRGKVDPRLVAEARNLAQLAVIAPRAILAQEQLAEALLRLEHGGRATVLLAQLTDGLADASRRRPLPARKGLVLTEGERVS